MKSKTIVLILILGLAAFLRLYHLGSYPPLNVDEAAIGYNAWSLIKTGKDEHGNPWPVHFKSFGDYKPGGYFYLVLPLVKILGLTEWAVRLPSALLAVATVYLVYLLGVLLWKDRKLGLIWAGILAISPWHLHFSRGGWESNAALFFICLGVYFFFSFLEKKESVLKLLVATVSLVGAMYIYHSARVVAPVLGGGLIFFNRQKLWQKRRKIIFPVILGGSLLLPLVFSFFRGAGTARFSGVGFLADTGPLWRVNELLNQHPSSHFPYIRIIHNKIVIYALALGAKYFSHFNGRFLFIDGDEVPRSKIPEMGEMFWFEFVFLLLGIWMWLRKKEKHFYFPFLWLGVAPLASAMTFQAPSALRALPMVIPLTFFVAYGIKGIVEKLEGKLLGGVWCGILLLYAWGVACWWNQYFVHYLKRYPSAWPDFRPTAQWLQKNQDRYDKICLEGNFDQPYILTLFYLQYPPEKIQREIKLTPPDRFGFSTVKHFGKYWFGDCGEDMFVLR